MIAVTQTLLHGQSDRPGNCLAACVATFLQRPLEEVPHFIEQGMELGDSEDSGPMWWVMLIGYMAGHGYWPVELDSIDDAEPGEAVFVMGMSPRDVMHQVIYRDGRLWHDPHPSRAGILDIREVLAWRPVRHDHTTPAETPLEGCDCTELCSMGPTCPGGMLAHVPGSGCWRQDEP